MNNEARFARMAFLKDAGLPINIPQIVGGVVGIDDRFFLLVEGVQFFETQGEDAVTLLFPNHPESFTPRSVVFTRSTGWKVIIGETHITGGPIYFQWFGRP
ncbi:MAG: hypothetical protein V1846_05410 [Candidatus Komeilibacteria bacterium]